MTTTNTLPTAIHQPSPSRSELEAEHAKIERSLKRRISKAKRAVVDTPLLADKIEARKKHRALEAELRDHRHNYFEFVCAGERG